MEQRKQTKKLRSRGAQTTTLSGEAEKILRTAFRALMRGVSNGAPFGLTPERVAVLQRELPITPSYSVAQQDTPVLVGFEFARNGELNLNLLAPVTGTVDPDTALLSRVAAPFEPLPVDGAVGTTHVKMVSMAAELDADRGILRMVNLLSAIIPWQGTETTVLEQYQTVRVHRSKPVFCAVGIVYYKERSGVMFSLKNGRFTPLTVALAAHPNHSKS